MSSVVEATLTKLVSRLKAMGIFKAVETVEPKGAPGNGLTAAVYLFSISLPSQISGLSAASGLYVFNIRIYTNMLQEPTAQIDTILANAVDKIFTALAGDFDLGDTIRNIDIFGELGTPLKAQGGYVEVGGTMYRNMDITLPLIVDDCWPLVA